MDPINGTMDYRKKAKTADPIFGTVPEKPLKIEPVIDSFVERKPHFMPTSLKRKMDKQNEHST